MKRFDCLILKQIGLSLLAFALLINARPIVAQANDAFSQCLKQVSPTDQWTDGLYVFEVNHCPSKKFYFLSSKSNVFSIDLSSYCKNSDSKKGVPQDGLFYFEVENTRYQIELVRLKKAQDITLAQVDVAHVKEAPSDRRWVLKPDTWSVPLRKTLATAINSRLRHLMSSNGGKEMLAELEAFDLEDQDDVSSQLDSEVASMPYTAKQARNVEVQDHRLPSSEPEVSKGPQEQEEGAYWKQVQSLCSDYLNKETCQSMKTSKGLECRPSPWRAFATVDQ